MRVRIDMNKPSRGCGQRDVVVDFTFLEGVLNGLINPYSCSVEISSKITYLCVLSSKSLVSSPNCCCCCNALWLNFSSCYPSRFYLSLSCWSALPMFKSLPSVNQFASCRSTRALFNSPTLRQARPLLQSAFSLFSSLSRA